MFETPRDDRTRRAFARAHAQRGAVLASLLRRVIGRG